MSWCTNTTCTCHGVQTQPVHVMVYKHNLYMSWCTNTTCTCHGVQTQPVHVMVYKHNLYMSWCTNTTCTCHGVQTQPVHVMVYKHNLYMSWCTNTSYTSTDSHLINEGSLLLSICSPQNEYQILSVVVQPLDNSICHLLPSLALVGVCLVCPHCQTSIQQQNTYINTNK